MHVVVACLQHVDQHLELHATHPIQDCLVLLLQQLLKNSFKLWRLLTQWENALEGRIVGVARLGPRRQMRSRLLLLPPPCSTTDSPLYFSLHCAQINSKGNSTLRDDRWVNWVAFHSLRMKFRSPTRRFILTNDLWAHIQCLGA